MMGGRGGSLGATVGVTYVEGAVSGPSGESRRVQFLVDTGAMYSLLPDGVWQALGLTPKRTLEFRLADGTAIVRRVSECHIAIAGADSHTPVVLGEPGDEPLLGVVTLENLGLVFDPFRRELQPMRMLLV